MISFILYNITVHGWRSFLASGDLVNIEDVFKYSFETYLCCTRLLGDLLFAGYVLLICVKL